jgi:hypothetical protein
LDSDPYLHQFFQANPTTCSGDLGFDVLAGLFYRIVDLTTAAISSSGVRPMASAAPGYSSAHRRISFWMLTA